MPQSLLPEDSEHQTQRGLHRQSAALAGDLGGGRIRTSENNDKPPLWAQSLPVSRISPAVSGNARGPGGW